MKLLSIIAAALIGLFPAQISPIVGTAVPQTPALVDTYLAANIDASQTTMTLANGLLRTGASLSGYICFTIDANTPTVEYVCGTASGASITGMTRGVDVINPNTTTTAYTHRRFASVQTTDYPTIQFLVRKMNGTDSLDAPLIYATTTASFVTTSDQLAHKAYVDSVAIAGGVVADNTTPGISRVATASNLALGTGTSGGYSYVAPSGAFNSTSSATTLVPVTKSNGKLSQGFLDLTEGFTFSGGVTSTAKTAITGQFSTTATTTLATTTMTGRLTLATTTPIGTDESASKGYVDNRILDVGATSTYYSVSNNVDYHATSTAGFVTAWAAASGDTGGSAALAIYVGASTSSYYTVHNQGGGKGGTNGDEATDGAAMIPKGYWFKIVGTNAGGTFQPFTY